jgi:hypothetical protein
LTAEDALAVTLTGMSLSHHDHERAARIAAALAGVQCDLLVCSLPVNVLMLSGYWPVIGSSIALATTAGDVLFAEERFTRMFVRAGFQPCEDGRALGS